MKRMILSAALVLPLASLPFVTGCDREVSSEKSVQVKDDGTKVTKESTVTETADGGVKKEETTVKDADGTKKTETTVTH